MKLPLAQTGIAVCGIAILIGLGTWQVQRMHWKEDIISKLDTAYKMGKKTPSLTKPQLDDLKSGKEEFAYGSLNGRWIREKSILLGPRTNDGRVGYHLLIPLEADGQTLIINTGWVSDLWQDTLNERLGALTFDDVNVRGVLHEPDWSSMASNNSPSNNVWFRADVGEIAKEKGLEDVHPFILYADTVEPPLPDVITHQQQWLPRNKHLQYALFWYAMAAALAGVFGFYLRDLNKKPA